MKESKKLTFYNYNRRLKYISPRYLTSGGLPWLCVWNRN